jgi:hypothetical protein
MSHSKFYTQKLLLRNGKGFDVKHDRFCAGINCVCSMCVKYLDKWVKPVKDFSCFIWMTFSDPLNLSGVKLYIQFLINNGLLVDDVKCFDLLSHLRTYMGRGLNDEKSSPVC